jgi:hypothetical protein
VPDTPSTECLVRVDVFDAANNEDSDVSDGFFTIEAGPANYVYVQSVGLSLVTKGKSTNAKATVVIRDQDGNPMFRAEVHSHWDGLTTDSDVFYTKKAGRGTCESDKLKDPVGCWDYYVDDVVVAGYVFRSDIGQTYGQICTYIAPGPSAVLADRFSVTHTCCDPVTEFTMSLPRTAHVTLSIYDIHGHRVKTLVDEAMPAGVRTLIWDGTNDWGQPVSSGVYFYRAAADDEAVTQKMMIVR